jgi:hypothetical protein
MYNIFNTPMGTLPPGHMRLLHIEPGSDESLIFYRLVPTELVPAPQHEGLFYTRGAMVFI